MSCVTFYRSICCVWQELSYYAHGLGSTREDAQDQTCLWISPATRAHPVKIRFGSAVMRWWLGVSPLMFEYTHEINSPYERVKRCSSSGRDFRMELNCWEVVLDTWRRLLCRMTLNVKRCLSIAHFLLNSCILMVVPIYWIKVWNTISQKCLTFLISCYHATGNTYFVGDRVWG